jgi:hypothetical protein
MFKRGTTLLELRCWNCVVKPSQRSCPRFKETLAKPFALVRRTLLTFFAPLARLSLLKKQTLHNIIRCQNKNSYGQCDLH